MREGQAISLCASYACRSRRAACPPPSSCLSQLLHAVYLMVGSYVINLEGNMDCPSVIKADDGFQGLQ